MVTPLETLRKDLFDALTPRVHPHGFVAKRGRQAYVRAESFGWSAVHLAFIAHPSVDFDVTASVSIRFEAVEQLVDPSRTKDGATIGEELGNIRDGGPFRWTIAGAEDVATVAPSISAMVEGVGLPFLARYSDAATVMEALARDDRESRDLSPFDGYRWRTLIVLASVLGEERLGEFIARARAADVNHLERRQLEETISRLQ